MLFNKRLVSDEEIKKIRSADWETCAKWWNTLNSWEWPDELLPSEPHGNGIEYKPEGRRSTLMNIIDGKVGHKYILMYLNVVKEKRMDYEFFEDFWDYSYNHDAEAGERYFKKSRKLREQFNSEQGSTSE